MVNKIRWLQVLILNMALANELFYQSFNGKIVDDSTWRTTSFIFTCDYGIQLVVLSLETPSILYTFTNINPHYQLQIIIDIYGYFTIDSGESTVIYIDSVQALSYSKSYSDSLTSCNYYNECYLDSTLALSIQTINFGYLHTDSTLTMKIITTTNEPESNEAYLIRNLQIFYSKCYQTCQTCSDQYSNSCLTCFTSASPISGVCNTCINEINKTFLLVTQGCIQECLTGYSFDSNRICYLNENLQVHLQLNYNIGTQDLTLVQSQVSTRTILICSSTLQLSPYYTSEILETTQSFTSITTMIRLRVSLFLFQIWSSSQSISILLNGVQIDNIILNGLIITTQQSVILYSDSTYQSCGSDQYIQIRLELNYQISSTNAIISFQANNVIDQSIFWSVINIDIEQLVCSTNCNSCSTTDKCQTCNLGYYLHKGQCKTICPNYSTLSSNSCIDYDEEYLTEYGREATYLVKEFYDTSTSIDRITSLFTLQTSSSNNFAKGSGIYFSYMPDKRVFGGNLVWINAVFLFQISFQQYYQKIQIRFQAVLGDSSSVNTNVFSYTINSQSQQSLTYQSLNPISSTQLWGDIYPDYIFQINEEIDYNSLLDNPTLQILFECQNSNTVVNQAFCAIQNLFITTIQYCPIQYELNLFLFYNNQFACQSICGDNIISENEECDDGNNTPFDGCFNCKYQCNDLCQFCIRGQCLYDDNYDLELNFNFNLDNITFIESTQDENIIVIIDDYQFNQNCSILCYLCSFGQCQQCQSGYYLDYLYNECITQCGDEIIAGNEQCDDGNNISTDGCYNCQIVNYNECDENCAFCYFSECIRCNYGFTLKNNECQSICGDNLVNKELENNKQIEECDNPNDDGCQNCQITTGYDCVGQDISICWTCGEYCTTCVNIESSLKCQECEKGYYANGSQCHPCDDNCITCSDFSYLCTSCYRNDCDFCSNIPGLYADKLLGKCVSECGDGILVQEYEECDDGNLDDGDGCDSQCNSEIDYYDSTQIVVNKYQGEISNNLSISSESTIYQIDCALTQIDIQGFEISDFTYNIISMDNSGGCQITFLFKKTIQKSNTINLIINYYFISSRILTSSLQKRISVTPTFQRVLDSAAQEQADAITNAQSSFSILFWIIVPLSFIFGFFNYTWTILEILSWVNNFYFLNVNYPFNVEVLFLNSDWSSIVSFPTYQGFNQPEDDYYFIAPLKFQQKGIDPLFINNAQVPLCFIISSILLYWISTILFQIFKLLNDVLKKEVKFKSSLLKFFKLKSKQQITQLTLQHSNSNEYDVAVQFKYNTVILHTLFFIKKITATFKSKIKSTISLCILDITTAITLQVLFAKQFQFQIILINQFCALFSIILIVYQIYISYSLINCHKILKESTNFILKYESYIENLDINKQFAMIYAFTGLLQKILYIFFMIFFYEFPLLQTTFCFLSNISTSFILIFQNPFEDKKSLIKALISEVGVSLIIFITIIFAVDDQVSIISENKKIILGWIIISIVFLCLLTEIFSVIFEITQKCILLINSLLQQGNKRRN